jgi:hypothetical protein
MKIKPVLAVLLAAGLAHADVPDASAPNAPEAMRIDLRDTLALSYPGATAAFSVDSSVAEASAADGRVTVVGRSVGWTTISVVTPTGISSFTLTVGAPPSDIASHRGSGSGDKRTTWQGNYESSTARLTNSLELVDRGDDRTLRGHVVNVLRLDSAPANDIDARASLPALSLEWRSKRDELVLFDKYIEHSPLTLDGTTVRGVHVRTSGVELHAGVTSPFLYQNVFLSTQREAVMGISAEMRAGRSSFVPSLYAYPSAPRTGGSDGATASLMYRYASRDERVRVRSELGWGSEPGAALEATYHGAMHRAYLFARHQPQGFAALGVGRPVGSMVDAMWSGEPAPRWTFNATANAARYDVGELYQDTASATTEGRYKLVPRLAVSTGASIGRFGGSATPATLRSITVPVGLHLDAGRFAGSAVYRYQANTARNEGGHGGRLSMRVRHGSLHASAFVDGQQDAATLQLILREEPVLAQLLNEMGLTAVSADDLARLLRENAALAQLGYVEGVTLDFNPWRTQTGADLAWLAQDQTRQQLRLRVLYDRTQTITREQETRSLSLSYSRRLGAAVDATGMLSWWSRGDQAEMQPAVPDTWSIAAGLRVRIDDVPRLPRLRTSRRIEGVVVNEAKAGAPIAGVMVRLDGGRAAVSDASGRFVFTDVEDGEHRVEAELPPDTYFTTPSRIAVAAGGSVRFGIAEAPARMTGDVHDDLGAGIAGVQLVLRGQAGTFTATTDSSGRFRFAVADGDYQLDLARDSIPEGYDHSAVTAQPFRLHRAEPRNAELVLRGNRSIAGTINVTPGQPASVTLVELGQSGAIDDGGRYVFRGLRPGTYTIEVTVGDQTARRVVEVPAAPTVVRGVDFR